MKKRMLHLNKKVLKNVVSFAFMMAAFGINTNCFGPLYQDELPQNASKLRKRKK
ncbi:MAG: cyclic lactone autoinducer peptide [Lachnospiraceae bacterium]|nr:cyclic lactone autoinducer peptide [Lachnospiraceae bacterium]